MVSVFAPTHRICGIMSAMEIVSLFSGAGGLDLGLIKAGHRVVWADDNVSVARNKSRGENS